MLLTLLWTISAPTSGLTVLGQPLISRTTSAQPNCRDTFDNCRAFIIVFGITRIRVERLSIFGECVLKCACEDGSRRDKRVGQSRKAMTRSIIGRGKSDPLPKPCASTTPFSFISHHEPAQLFRAKQTLKLFVTFLYVSQTAIHLEQRKAHNANRPIS